MKFTELESLMLSRGVSSLAEIARILNTTPQAVSNWKARDQVPYHIVSKINQMKTIDKSSIHSSAYYEDNTISFSDILLTMAEQLKIILLMPFIAVFFTFTYVQLIQQPKYTSFATIILPESGGNLGGLAGLASQFGVYVPSGAGGKADLSSPSLFPELLRSRTFANKILDKKFYTEKYDKELSLLAILLHGDGPPDFGRDTMVTMALSSLGKILEFNVDPISAFSVIKVTTFEPMFSKQLAEVVLEELENLNRFYKSRTTNEKTIFIKSRISSVKGDLESSEQRYKAFNEQNRQISSPALQLEEERLARDVEIQKGIYLTLKQQLELAKIEEIQEASIVQILDEPQVPLQPSNKNLKSNVLLAGVLGIIIGILLGFVRAYLNNSNIDERRKLRRVQNFLKKKGKDVILDRRFSAIISLLLFIGLPFYLGHESKTPVYFGMYSPKYMLVNIVYVLTLIASIGLFIYRSRKKT